jgi:tetratricopeptide (TPR) repeat protein
VNTAGSELFALALEANQHLLGPHQGDWLDRLDREREPLRALLDDLIATSDSELALRLAGALAGFWWMRGHTPTGRERLERALALPGGSDTARAVALLGAGSLAYAAADFRRARDHFDSALPLLHEPGSELDRARALDRAGMAARQLMDLPAAHELHTRALDLQRQHGSPAEQALCLNNLGVVAFFSGDLESARAYHQEALALRTAAGDVRGEASSRNNLGQVARFAGDLEAARTETERSLELRRQIDDRWGVAGAQVNLAVVHVHEDDLETARLCLEEAVAGFRAVGDQLGLCECLEAAAELACTEGRHADAVALSAAAVAQRDRLPAPLSPLHQRAQAEMLAVCRAALGTEAYREAEQRGREGGEALLPG